MSTYADVDAFLAKWLGKSIDRDGAFGAQCVDFAAQYTAELFGVGYLPTPVTGGARDIYERFSLGAYFDKIPNTPDYVPVKGDIVIWTAFSNNQFGHIAIASGEGDTNTFVSYDQNWNVQKVERIRHNYNSVLGALRPKALTAVAPQGDIMNAEQVKDLYRQLLGREAEPGGLATYTGKPWATVYYAIKDSAEGQAYTKAKAKQLQDLKDQIASQQVQIDKLNKQIADLGSQPVTQDQAAAVVADVIKPAVGFWAKVWAWVKK